MTFDVNLGNDVGGNEQAVVTKRIANQSCSACLKTDARPLLTKKKYFLVFALKSLRPLVSDPTKSGSRHVA